MLGTKGKSHIYGILTIALLTVAILHTVLHFAVYGTGVPNLGEKGISGFAVGPISGDEIKTQYPQPSLSTIVIVAEWLLLIVILVISFMSERLNLKKEADNLKDINIKQEKSKTELDVLYDLLKEKKHLQLATIAKIFQVSEETVHEWAKILESGNLATIYYPRLGEPEIRIKEK